MYNQFILEELKTLKDLLQAGAITQGEFDHLKQILIDGTKASGETSETNAHAERTITGDVYENPDEVIRYYSNETKNLLLYKQFDKAYPFVQKILSLRPEHREANRFLQEIKTYIRRDYLIGGAIGVVLACVLSAVLAFGQDQDINLVFLCILPVLAGLLLPRLASSVLIGKVSSRSMRYLISAMLVVVAGCVINVALANMFMSLERGGIGNGPDPISSEGLVIDTAFYNPNETPDELTTVQQDTAKDIEPIPNYTPENKEEKSIAVVNPNSVTEPVEDKGNKGGKQASIENVAEEDAKTVSVKKILNAYYQDLSGQKLDANKYYARSVKRFLTASDVTPQIISEALRNNYYTDFQGAISTIKPNSLEISQNRNGMYQADFKEEMKCFRKSANKGQTITSKVKIIFDRNMKIVWYSSTVLSTKEFGEGSDEKNVGQVVSLQNTNQ